MHRQRQAGLNWVGACVPAGRLHAADFEEIAAVAEKYGDGTVRITCEENVIFTNVPDAKLEAMKAEPLFQRFPIFPGVLLSGMVSCTGELCVWHVFAVARGTYAFDLGRWFGRGLRAGAFRRARGGAHSEPVRKRAPKPLSASLPASLHGLT